MGELAGVKIFPHIEAPSTPVSLNTIGHSTGDWDDIDENVSVVEGLE